MKVLQVAVGVIKNASGEVFISLRDKELHQGGLWEFPGGKVELDESIEQALKRELNEELAITVRKATPLITIKHAYPDRHVQLHVFLVHQFTGNIQHNQGQPWCWVTTEALNQYNFPAANKPIVTAARLPHYYAILDDRDENRLFQDLLHLLDQNISLIQARLKRLSASAVEAFLKKAYPVCKHHQATLLLNSGMNWLHPTYTDGLHLTSSHLMNLNQRPDHYRWVAASCHNLAEVRHAQKIGVDFAVLAPILPTQTHIEANPLGWQQFSSITSEATIPLYALGGLAKSDLVKAQQHGAQGIAAIRAFLR